MSNADTTILGLPPWYLSKTESCNSLTQLLGWVEGAVKGWEGTTGCELTLFTQTLCNVWCAINTSLVFGNFLETLFPDIFNPLNSSTDPMMKSSLFLKAILSKENILRKFEYTKCFVVHKGKISVEQHKVLHS